MMKIWWVQTPVENVDAINVEANQAINVKEYAFVVNNTKKMVKHSSIINNR